MKQLTANGISVRLGGKLIVRDVSFTLSEGDWLMLAGPNGAGKTTLLNAVSGLTPCEGSRVMDGCDLSTLKPAALARRISVMSQQVRPAYGFTVRETVAMGRYAYNHGLLHRGDPDGERLTEEAIRQVGLESLRERSILTLSGGEQQRVWLAQALCQQPEVLMLDEPGNHLDLMYQKQIYELVDAWRRIPGHAVISVMHDLSLAKRYGSHALLMNGGESCAFGRAEEVLQGERLNSVWSMDVAEWFRTLYRVWE